MYICLPCPPNISKAHLAIGEQPIKIQGAPCPPIKIQGAPYRLINIQSAPCPPIKIQSAPCPNIKIQSAPCPPNVHPAHLLKYKVHTARVPAFLNTKCILPGCPPFKNVIHFCTKRQCQ